ncbi:MAG: alpha/beta hydrolase [Clostridia bacterium]|nr:alpha/beta hydrolase [Clostridia bacterium]
MKRTVLYIHGRGGSAEEAAHYRALFPDSAVLGIDYRSETPWEAAEEFPRLFNSAVRGQARVTVIANSIGAYFTMCALADKPIERAFFISPVVDMEKLILDMMRRANVSEDELRIKGTIPTSFGEELSWDYLCHVREHPLSWTVPTEILYGSRDALTAFDTISAFADSHNAGLTVMDGGEHWFHTAEQMEFLDSWLMEKSDQA